MKHYDIAIIGGRVAAAAALISLGKQTPDQQNLSIAVIAPVQQPASGPLIGESLPPTVIPLLQQLNVWDQFTVMAFNASFVRYTCWDSNQLQQSFANQNPYGYGWSVDRRAFEQMLWSEATQSTFTRFECTCNQAHYSADRWQLELATGTRISARFVLDCSGRAAIFARKQSSRKKASQMLAACDFLSPLSDDIEPSAGVMIEAVKEGWWYSSLLPNGQLAVAYFSDRALLPKDLCRNHARWQQYLAQTEYTRLRIETGGFESYRQPRLSDASMSCLQQVGGDNWLACGDAAMTLDPLSAHGMTTALWSGHKGALAASAALRGNPLPLQQYLTSCQQNWQLYQQQRADIYAAQTRFNDSPFWCPS